MERFNRVKESYQLFVKFGCCLEGLNGDLIDDALPFVEENRMRCLIMNCLAALNVVEAQRKKQQEVRDDGKHESVEKKVLRAACLMMIDTESDNEDVIVITALSAFPDESKMTDKRGWLSMHFAIALFVQNKISAEDIHLLYRTDPLAMHCLSETERRDVSKEIQTGCTAIHLLLMEKQPNMEMVRYFSLRDPKAFYLFDQKGRCAIHLAVQYSESVELLQTILQID